MKATTRFWCNLLIRKYANFMTFKHEKKYAWMRRVKCKHYIRLSGVAVVVVVVAVICDCVYVWCGKSYDCIFSMCGRLAKPCQININLLSCGSICNHSQNHTQSAQLNLLAMSSVKYYEYMLADDSHSHTVIYAKSSFFPRVTWNLLQLYPLNLAQYNFSMAQPIFHVGKYTCSDFRRISKCFNHIDRTEKINKMLKANDFRVNIEKSFTQIQWKSELNNISDLFFFPIMLIE